MVQEVDFEHIEVRPDVTISEDPVAEDTVTHGSSDCSECS
jgi:hypothetical protein